MELFRGVTYYGCCKRGPNSKYDMRSNQQSLTRCVPAARQKVSRLAISFSWLRVFSASASRITLCVPDQGRCLRFQFRIPPSDRQGYGRRWWDELRPTAGCVLPATVDDSGNAASCLALSKGRCDD